MTVQESCDSPLTTAVRIAGTFNLARTLAPLRRGSGDPQMRSEGATIWRACRTPLGPATMRLTPRPAASEVAATVWGPGAEWALEQLPHLVGAIDVPAQWSPSHPLLQRLARSVGDVRLCRTGLLMEALVPAVLEQKVTGVEAWRSWRELLRRHGERAPGPAPLWLPPAPDRLARLASWDWHLAGVEAKRSLTIRYAAVRAAQVEKVDAATPAEVRRRLETMPGVGVWTSAEVAQRALGDADAVSVGDYHLPSLVGWSLTGRRTDDEGMLVLLEAERPHRYRAIRLLELAGTAPPRHGPRMSPRQFRGM